MHKYKWFWGCWLSNFENINAVQLRSLTSFAPSSSLNFVAGEIMTNISWFFHLHWGLTHLQQSNKHILWVSLHTSNSNPLQCNGVDSYRCQLQINRRWCHCLLLNFSRKFRCFSAFACGLNLHRVPDTSLQAVYFGGLWCKRTFVLNRSWIFFLYEDCVGNNGTWGAKICTLLNDINERE